MNQIESGLKERQSYLPPCAEIIKLETQTVLCGSGMHGSSNTNGGTESVGINGFDWN